MSQLNKESVEQAGGDERAAFEVWASALGWKLSPDQNNCGIVVAERYGHPGVQRCWEAWQARAALAQPSPAPAEAERPEVVARVVHSNPVVLGQCGPLNANDELMTVAQHAASVARWAEMFNRVEQERDAALARVEQQERTIAGMNEAHAKLAGLYEAAQAQHSVPEGFREKFEQCMELAFAEIAQYVSPEKARDTQSRARRASTLATELRAMLADEPGKEVGHE
ncbi:TPA: hypothetical protein ACKPFN_003658 [Pseudomonas aeruginosa]